MQPSFGLAEWEGVAHVFDLPRHPRTTRAYAWSSPIERSTKNWFFAVLHTERINSPVEAVRAAIVAEHRAQRHDPGLRPFAQREKYQRSEPQPHRKQVLREFQFPRQGALYHTRK